MNERCCVHLGGHGDEAPSLRLARGRDKVRGAILLAAGGRFGVIVANLPDARQLADELHDEAEDSGVAIVVDQLAAGTADLLVRHA